MNAKSPDMLSDIRRDFERVSPEIVKKASQYAASILADVAGRRGTLDGRIAAVNPSVTMAGPRFHDRGAPRRQPDDPHRHGDGQARRHPGDRRQGRPHLLMGSIMINACKKMNFGGVVIDAAVRDIEELRELGFPVYAVGTNPNGPTKFTPGRINWPISCGGISVNPGDLLVGDADGVVVVEREKAESLLDARRQESRRRARTHRRHRRRQEPASQSGWKRRCARRAC